MNTRSPSRSAGQEGGEGGRRSGLCFECAFNCFNNGFKLSGPGVLPGEQRTVLGAGGRNDPSCTASSSSPTLNGAKWDQRAAGMQEESLLPPREEGLIHRWVLCSLNSLSHCTLTSPWELGRGPYQGAPGWRMPPAVQLTKRQSPTPPRKALTPPPSAGQAPRPLQTGHTSQGGRPPPATSARSHRECGGTGCLRPSQGRWLAEGQVLLAQAHLHDSRGPQGLRAPHPHPRGRPESSGAPAFTLQREPRRRRAAQKQKDDSVAAAAEAQSGPGRRKGDKGASERSR